METTLQTPQDTVQRIDRTDSTCIICGDEARFYCSPCKEVTYCSHECADADAYVHQMLCLEVESFKTSQRRKTVRAIAFRHNKTKPEFIWLSRFNDNQRTKAMVHLMGGMHRPEPIVIDSNALRNRNHETIHGFVLQNYSKPRAERNKTMQLLAKLISRQTLWKKKKFPWYGTTIFVAVKSGTTDYGDDLRDFTMTDFRNLCDWLLVTLRGQNLMSCGVVEPDPASPTQKVKGVHIRGLGDGKFDFTQIFFPRDYPFSLQLEWDNDTDSDDSTETARRKFRKRKRSEDNLKEVKFLKSVSVAFVDFVEVEPKETPRSAEARKAVSGSVSRKRKRSEDNLKEVEPIETPPSAEAPIAVTESVGLTLVAVFKIPTSVNDAEPKIKSFNNYSNVAVPGSLTLGGMPGGLEPIPPRDLYEVQDWEQQALTETMDVSFYRKDLKNLLPQHMEALWEFVRRETKSSAKGKGKEVDPGPLQEEVNMNRFELFWQIYKSEKGWNDIPSPYIV